MPILASPDGVAAPVVTPRAPSPFYAMDMRWTGADGSAWTLSESNAAVRLNRGVEGLSVPEFDGYRFQPPGVHGAFYRGSRVKPREVFWPVRVRASSSAEFLTIDRAFWRSLSRDTVGTWTVTPPGREPRSLDLRLSEVEFAADIDPVLAARAVYGVHLVADQPFWRGSTISRQFVTDSPAPFFSTTGVISISAGNTLGSATIDNPGDEPAWPTWTLTGPFTSATIGVAGKSIVIPFALVAGQSLTIETRPDLQTVIDSSGTDRVNDLGAVAFGQVPPGASVPLNINAVATGAGMSATASLTPLYGRAW